MGLVGFNKLIHSDVPLGNAKCTILVLNMRWALPEEGGRLLRTGHLIRRGLGRSTDILE